MKLEDTKSQSSGSSVCLKVGSSDKAMLAMSEAYNEMTTHISETKACAKVLSAPSMSAVTFQRQVRTGNSRRSTEVSKRRPDAEASAVARMATVPP